MPSAPLLPALGFDDLTTSFGSLLPLLALGFVTLPSAQWARLSAAFAPASERPASIGTTHRLLAILAPPPGGAAGGAGGAGGGTSTSSALATSSRPPVTVLPASATTGLADASSALLTSATVADGFSENSSPAAPLTCGAAIEVPSRKPYAGGVESGALQVTGRSSSQRPSATVGDEPAVKPKRNLTVCPASPLISAVKKLAIPDPVVFVAVLLKNAELPSLTTS